MFITAMKFIAIQVLCLLFFASLIGSMLTYRGGHPSNLTSPYSLRDNFLSDLGLKNDYAHKPVKPVTRLLFWIALGCAAAALLIFLFSLPMPPSLMRTLVLSAGLLATGSLLALITLPSDLFFTPHRLAAVLAFTLIAVIFLLLALTPSSGLKGAGLMATLVGGYVAFIILGPRPDVGPLMREIHVIAQKVTVSSIFLYIYWASVFIKK